MNAIFSSSVLLLLCRAMALLENSSQRNPPSTASMIICSLFSFISGVWSDLSEMMENKLSEIILIRSVAPSAMTNEGIAKNRRRKRDNRLIYFNIMMTSLLYLTKDILGYQVLKIHRRAGLPDLASRFNYLFRPARCEAKKFFTNQPPGLYRRD